MTAVESMVGDDLPEECLHKEWQLGCPRCFAEMRGISDGVIKVSNGEAFQEGAILSLWHMMIVLADLDHQLIPMSKSLDLKKAELGLSLAANLRNLSAYMMRLAGDPVKLDKALVAASMLAAQAKERLQQEAAPAPPPLMEQSRIFLTDGVL